MSLVLAVVTSFALRLLVAGSAFALPWASLLQTPAGNWPGQREGLDVVLALAQQAAWIAVLLLAARGVVRLATRRVVVRGG